MLDIINPDNLYRLRNGVIVEAFRPDNSWSVPATVVANPVEPDFPMDDHSCLIFLQGGKQDDPLTWTGGSFGPSGDVIEKVTLADVEAARAAMAAGEQDEQAA